MKYVWSSWKYLENNKKKRKFFVWLVYSPGSSGWPLPLSANVTTANAIATPIAEPYAAISASAM